MASRLSQNQISEEKNKAKPQTQRKSFFFSQPPSMMILRSLAGRALFRTLSSPAARSTTRQMLLRVNLAGSSSAAPAGRRYPGCSSRGGLRAASTEAAIPTAPAPDDDQKVITTSAAARRGNAAAAATTATPSAAAVTDDLTFDRTKSGTPSPWAVFDAWGAAADESISADPLTDDELDLLGPDAVRIPVAEGEREGLPDESEILSSYDHLLRQKSS